MLSDRDLEQEVVIRWDRASDVALLYTADSGEMRRWQRLGYPVEVMGTINGGKPHSWQTTVPVAAIALLPMKQGRLQISRWLEPPTIQDRAQKPQEPREPEKAREIVKEIDADFPAA